MFLYHIHVIIHFLIKYHFELTKPTFKIGNIHISHFINIMSENIFTIV